jgi:hypothetical protein
MKIVENGCPSFGKVIVGLDVEWTKNYHITNGNRAFCFSLVSVKQDRYELSLLEQELTFGFHLDYAESEEECQQLCQHADRLVALALSEQNVIVGHQFSSDISVLLACADGSLPAIEALQYAWRTRNQSQKRSTVKVFDTRYDLGTPKEESHRLVDVCNSWNLAVTQPEIAGSMTKMQRDFYSNQSSLILEKIAVLNLRHSLSSILLYLFHLYERPICTININEILYRNLAGKFDYVESASFRALLADKEGLYPQSARV